jgi:hypothetical protein
VRHLQGLVDRLMAERAEQAARELPASRILALGSSAAAEQPPPAVPSPLSAAPLELKGEDGVQYVITPDGTLDTKANYDRAMSMLDRTLAGKAAYDLGDTTDEQEAGPGG